MTDSSINVTNAAAGLHNDTSYYPKGGSAGIKGGIYQVKLLMLFLHRSLTKQYSFRLATELKTAGKFDDLVIEYNHGKKTEHRFLQAKHKEDESKKFITFEMLCEDDGDFSLLKYFKSYREIKENPEYKDSLKDVIICTNIGLKGNDIESALEKIGNADDILDFQNQTKKASAIYKFKDNFDGKERLIEVLRKGSSLYTLAKKLAECVYYDKPIQIHQRDSVFHLYHNFLANDVIDYVTKSFKGHFLNPSKEESSDEVKEFRNFFLEEIKLVIKKHPESTVEKNKNENKVFDFNCDDDIFQQIKDKKVKLKLSKGFGESSEKLHVSSLDEVCNAEINKFLNRLVLAVSQPNERELGEILINEFQKEFNKSDAKIFYSLFYGEMNDWMKSKEGKFLTQEDGRDIFKIIKETILRSVCFDIRDPVRLFTGRKEELTKLHNAIQRNTKGAVVSQMTSISGLGGIGKSELARKYVYDYRQKYDGNVMWINAETNETLEDSFIRLARDNKLGIPLKDKYGKEKELTSVVKEIYEFFGKGKSLFIFDNAENNEVLHKFLPLLSLPPQFNKPFVLVTSRDKEWEDGMEIIQLNVWSTEEAIEFVKKGLNLNFDKSTVSENVLRLVTELQCFPLALQQAISYIRYEQFIDEFDIKDYLKLYENKKKDLLDSKIFQGIDNHYTKTTFATWKITIDRIGCDSEYGQLAVDILNTISYFSSRNIHKNFLLGLGNNEDEQKLKYAVRLLVKYSLLGNENKQKLLYIHKLVQEVIRLELKDQGKAEKIIRKTLAFLNTYWLNFFNSGNKCPLNGNVDHSMSVWKHANECSLNLIKDYCFIPSHIVVVLTNNVRYEEAQIFGSQALLKLQSLGQASELNILNAILLLKKSIGNVFLKQGDYDICLTIFSEIYSIQKSLFGENNENTLNTNKNIAEVYLNQGRNGEAVRIYEKVLQCEQNVFPENHACILLTKIDLGNALLSAGNYREGVGILEDVVKVVKDNEQRNHPLIYRARSSLASGFYCCGKYDEAMQLLDDAEELERLIYANDHPDTLSTKKVRASIQFKKGKYKESLVMYESILKIEKETFSEDILTILSSKYCSGLIHVEQGHYDEGLKILKETLDGRQHILGEDHNSSWEIMQSIADVYCAQGTYAEALKIYERVLINRERRLGTRHPETLSTSSNMAYCLLKKGLSKDSLVILKDVLVIKEEVFGESHPETLATKNSIGLNLLELGKYDEALEMFQEVFQVQKTDSSGPEHPNKLKALNNIGIISAKHKKYEDALSCFDTVLCKQKKTLGENHPDSLNTQVNKAKILLSLNKFDEALIILYSVCNINETDLPETHPVVLSAKGTIAQVHIQKNEPKLALEILDKLLKILIKNNHFQDILQIKHAIAGAKSLLGKHAESLELYQEVYVAMSKTLAEDNPEIILTKFGIGIQNLNLGNFRKGLKILLEVLEMQTKIFLPDNADIANSRQEISTWLLAEGKQWTVLHLASSCSNDPEFIQKLLQEGFDINAVTRDGFQPLHLAAEYNNYETCQALIKYFKDKYANKLSGFINARIDDSKRTTLHIAAENDNMEIVVMLLQNGADYSVRDKKGMSPLFWSISGSRVNFLLKCTEDLFVAVENGDKNVAVSILDNLNSNFSKAVLNARNNRNRTAIQMSVTHNQRDLAQILVSKLDS